ncbi:MAG: transposase [Xanthomonadales bacterium]|nr:transposase [Xanthomonadales bacterium]
MDASQGHRRLRTGRRSLAGQIYIVTTTSFERRALFADREIAIMASRSIADARAWGDARLLCWVLMPDHWHGLIQLGDDDALGVVVNRFKSVASKAVRRVEPGIGPVWARAYHDHALRREDDILAVARYIVRNPVRAGLVERVGDYPFWDAIWLS